MTLRHILLYPPLSWLLAWAINDPAVDETPNLTPTRTTMRLPFQATDEAKAAAKRFIESTGLYASAVGRRVKPAPLSILMSDRISELFDQDNADKWPDAS